MSDRRLFILDTRDKRIGVARIVAELPKFSRVEIKGPARTLPQNDKMWAMLTEIAAQATWHGEKLSELDWKDLFSGAVKIAGGGVRAVPGLEGGIMLLGLRTSEMTVAEMANLITYIEAWGAQNGVTFSDFVGDQGGAGAKNPRTGIAA
jgi:hypothetical protein